MAAEAVVDVVVGDEKAETGTDSLAASSPSAGGVRTAAAWLIG
jgi:hypothetical protein